MEIDQVRDIDVRINFRGGEARVTEHLLDLPDALVLVVVARVSSFCLCGILFNPSGFDQTALLSIFGELSELDARFIRKLATRFR